MSMLTARPTTHGLPSRKPVLLAAMLLSLLIALALAVSSIGGRQHASTSPASGVVDPRLVVRPHTERLSVPLTGGPRLAGSLYPALPGPNTLRLAALQGDRATSGRVEVTVTMLGMAMTPVHATLSAHGHGYSGTVTLPMFGHYRAGIVVHTPSGRYSGAVIIALTLPGEQ